MLSIDLTVSGNVRGWEEIGRERTKDRTVWPNLGP